MVQETVQLKPEITDEILTNQRLQSRLQLAFGKTYFSIRRWAKENNVILTTITALNIISEETGKPINELVNE